MENSQFQLKFYEFTLIILQYYFQLKVYHAVIEDVIASVRDAFLDDGVDEQVLQEMKQIWRSKLMASKAVEINPDPPEQPPQIVANNPKVKIIYILTVLSFSNLYRLFHVKS